MQGPRDSWRLLPVLHGNGFRQMAVDHALLSSASTDESPPTLRFYRFDPPSLTLGRFQPLESIDLNACYRLGIDVVRRPTGGKAILHKDDFTYSLAVPPSAGLPGSVEDSYMLICRGIIAALERLGIEADLVPRNPYELKEVHSCFSSPAAADLSVGGKKLCGSAQTRRDGALLQHGTILRKDNAELLFNLFTYPDEVKEARRKEMARACTNLEELGADVSWDEISQAFVGGFEKAFGITMTAESLTPAEEGLSFRSRSGIRIGLLGLYDISVNAFISFNGPVIVC